MPELPEVEAVRHKLASWIEGQTMEKVGTTARHRGMAPERDLLSLIGCHVNAVRRLGKYLLCDLGSQYLVIHLGMSGRLLSPDGEPYTTGLHDHLSFGFRNRRV